jgi:hypothetical protein
MAQCAVCGAATELYVNGVPLCSQCDDKRENRDAPMPERPDKADKQSA